MKKTSRDFKDGSTATTVYLVTDTVNALSELRAMMIFDTIAISPSLKSNELNKNLDLTSKQFYKRISDLIKTGLVIRMSGKYCLTSYGKIVHKALNLIETGASNYSNLKAIDSLQASNISQGLSEKEKNKIIDVLITSEKIKDILLNKSLLDEEQIEKND